MKSMKSITTAGLCLVAMLVVSMVAAGTASATNAPTPEYQICTKGGAEPPTKYTTENCEVASGSGEWNFRGINGTEKSVSLGTLRLADTKVLGKTVEVSCTGKDEGSVGPGKFGRVEAITEIKCTPGENCAKITAETKPLNLPWQTELAEGGKRTKIKATNGKGAGWAVTCEVSGIALTDECTTEEGTVGNFLRFTPGFFNPNVNRWLLLTDFENLKASERAKCTVGGAEAGRVLGSDAVLRATLIGGKFEDLNLF